MSERQGIVGYVQAAPVWRIREGDVAVWNIKEAKG